MYWPSASRIFSSYFTAILLNYRTLYLGHLRGIAYPSRPGLRGMLEMVLRQERHWMVMLVALARIAEALIMIPGIFTSLAICSD